MYFGCTAKLGDMTYMAVQPTSTSITVVTRHSALVVFWC